MIRTALLVEIEGLLFDTASVRTTALHKALVAEGFDCHADDVRRAHAGVPAHVALHTLVAGRKLDDTGQALVLRRASDLVADAFAHAAPTFDPDVRDHLFALAAEFPIGVVTRAVRSDARRMLESIGLDGCIGTVSSLDDTNGTAPHAPWSETVTRLRADRGVAFAPLSLLRDAAAAGLQIVEVTGLATVISAGRTTPFTMVDADVIASLFSLS